MVRNQRTVLSVNLPCPQPIGGESWIDVNIPTNAVGPTFVVSPSPWVCPDTTGSVTGSLTSPGVFRVVFRATGGTGVERVWKGHMMIGLTLRDASDWPSVKERVGDCFGVAKFFPARSVGRDLGEVERRGQVRTGNDSVGPESAVLIAGLSGPNEDGAMRHGGFLPSAATQAERKGGPLR